VIAPGLCPAFPTLPLSLPEEIAAMSLDSVRAFFAEKAPEIRIIELDTSTATVALAAQAHGVEPGQIAKALAFRVG